VRILWIAILGFVPAVAEAQMLGSSLISTSSGGTVSGTYGYFKYVSATNINVPVSFSVNKGGTDQTITASTITKLTWSTEKFDTNNNFASNRFTPTVPGKYLVILNMFCTDGSSGCSDYIYKNGVNQAEAFNTAYDPAVTVSAIIDMNGTTDYLEAYGWNTNGTNISGNAALTFFSGIWLAP
jgi:hypothetical protein